ncbi:MAG: TIGR03087 family PEP-CTERM/XrtA system glycosyltransferase [Planctomycetota bacterium]
MKILFLAHRVPFPPNKGDKIRSYHELVELARDHEVTLVTFIERPEDRAAEPELRPLCRGGVHLFERPTWKALARTASALVTGRSLSLGYFHSPELQERVDTLLDGGDFDFVVVFSSQMAQYVIDRTRPPRLMDFVDLDSQKWALYSRKGPVRTRLLHAIEARRLVRFEREVAARFEHVSVISSAEAEDVRRLLSRPEVLVVPSGVDLQYFTPAQEPESDAEPSVVFTGVMSYFANVDAVRFYAEEVHARLRQSFPGLRFVIAGADPSPAVKRLEKIPGVVVTGTVADMRPFLHRAAVAVAPLRIARGLQNKILEALACGRPVVAHPEALKGIAATPGEHLLTATTAEEFVQTVGALLEDAALRERLGGAGRSFVESHYDWESCLEPFRSLFRRAPDPVAAGADRGGRA